MPPSRDLSFRIEAAQYFDREIDRVLTRFRRSGRDLIAGLTTTLVTIPDALASAVLAGLNPIHGLYALIIGVPIAALAMSSQLMYVANTGALAVATGSALAPYQGDSLVAALIVLTFLVGAIQLALGLLRLGGVVRFVSNAVMVGFMTAIMLRIIISQLGELTGYKSDAKGPLPQLGDFVMNLGQIHLPTFALGLVAIAIIVGVGHTALRNFSMILAVVIASAAIPMLGLDVRTVADIATIPSGLPLPELPQFSLIAQMLPSAFAIALIGLVQAAGVSRSLPNPDGRFPNISRDFAGQGLANLSLSFFKGMPIGGTMSETAVHVGAGATSRWAAVYSGIMILAFVLLLGDLIEQVAKPAIAALLIVAAIEVIRPREIHDIWRTSLASRLVLVVTFVATLLLPVEQSVLLGVILSVATHLHRSSRDVEVVAMSSEDGVHFDEHSAPAVLPSGEVTVLNVYGTLYFGAADTFESYLPSARGVERAVVILRLRGRRSLGTTIYNVLERYAAELARGGGRLILSGVNDALYDQLIRTDLYRMLGESAVIRAERRPEAAMRRALIEAREWLDDNAGGAS